MKEQPVLATIALGSNVGDRRAHLSRARAALAALDGSRLVQSSSFHETRAIGGPPGQNCYLNAVLELETRHCARELLARMQAIERAAGRDRAVEVRNGPRTLDLDLLFFGDEQIDEPGLSVPHPRLEERLFVLGPLAELCPDRILPSCGRSVSERLRDLQGSTGSPGSRPECVSAETRSP